jgi:16S rRNA (cytidine1402-2'-O)-methyltransferase
MGTLYLIATPIGNLEDLSPRAVRLLGAVRLIAAEDTRQSRHLLRHFDIHTPLTSYFEHNKLGKLDTILQTLAEGDVALISDAGTPALNDPGYELVRACLAAGHTVSPIPGPSAPLAALVASGLPTDRFLYLGYLPRKGGERRRAIAAVAHLPYTLIFLEAPHRLLAALADLEAELGDRPAAVARELTKLFEEIRRGPLSELRAHFAAVAPRGEITLVIAGQTEAQGALTPFQLDEAIRAGLAAGEAPPSLAARLTEAAHQPRREIYRRILALTTPDSDDNEVQDVDG